MALILILEDDKVLRDLIELSLEREGHEAVTALSWNEASEKLGNKTPNLILIDLFLPQTNPIALIRQFKNQSSVPIIIISAFGYREAIQQSLDAGAIDYLLKPLNIDDLIERITKYLEKKPASVINKKKEEQKKITKPIFRRLH